MKQTLDKGGASYPFVQPITLAYILIVGGLLLHIFTYTHSSWLRDYHWTAFGDLAIIQAIYFLIAVGLAVRYSNPALQGSNIL